MKTATKHRRSILTPQEREKPWIPAVFNYSQKRLAVIGANGSAKSTYVFKFLFTLCIHRPRLILITSGTLTQADKLISQKLKPMLEMIGFRKKNESRKEYELINGVEIHVRSRENFETVEGIEYDCWFADEFQDHSQDAAEMFLKRTRRDRDNSMVRIAGLPEAPDSWQYEFLENNGFELHEISLYDHPDPEWIEYYAGVLEMLFSGNKLKRYRDGLRVSVAGVGLFSVEPDHYGEVPAYDPEKELHLYWDFNNEYRAVTAWQQGGMKTVSVAGRNVTIPIFNCISDHEMKEATTTHDAAKLADYYKNEKNLIYLNGDQTGESRTAASTESMWYQVRKVFEKSFPRLTRFILPNVNPLQRDTIQAVNFVLMAGLIKFGHNAQGAYNDLVAMQSDKYGEIDKKVDNKPGGPKSHKPDTVRYFCYHTYKQYLPGTQQPFIK